MEYFPHHSRSSSASSAVSSRPQSASGMLPVVPSTTDLYHYVHSHTRHSSTASSYASDLNTPADSPPNHNLANPALAIKSHLQRPSHFRARIAASPYPRDTDSVHSSSSETEDLSMFFEHSPPDYIFQAGVQHEAAGAFGRMTLGPDHALEQLAANVRAATTTSASDRAKQIFVQAWLTANYAPYPDGNVPRQGLYFSYRRVCDQYGIPHINTATLGKAIRLCFPTIKTRRLGVRGNSKYHYCGIRPATTTEAEFLQDYIRKANSASQHGSHPGMPARSNSTGSQAGEDRSDEDDEEDSEGARSKRNSLTLAPGSASGPTLDGGMKSPTLFAGMDMCDKTPTTNSILAQSQQRPPSQPYQHATIRRHPATEGHPSPPQTQGGAAPSSVPSTPGTSSASSYMSPHPRLSVRQLPNFPTIEEAIGSSDSAYGQAAREVWGLFEDHLDSLLESVRSFRFDQVEMTLRTFWPALSPNHREIVHAPVVAGLMTRADAMVYDEILEILRSHMLSTIPATSLNSLRGLADKMEKVLLTALEQYGATFVEPKVELGARFGHLVLRILDIFQVTQALTTVLTNPKQLADMRRSWHNVDFESVRNQSALVCNCRHEDLVQLLEVDFTQLLERVANTTEPVRAVMAWADECCERLMVTRGTVPDGEGRQLSSRSVLIRWAYVTSQVMRDLTIRSDPAFGAFQILKLFLDDWIALNVLRHVALSTNSVQASVEPVIQQQFFTLSPMPGQESFNTMDTRGPQQPSHLLGHTPTTSSMLAALHDPFPTTLDPTGATAFGTDAFGWEGHSDDTPGHSFGDYANGHSSAFDVNSFTQELGLQAATPDHGSANDSSSGVKDEGVKEEGPV